MSEDLVTVDEVAQMSTKVEKIVAAREEEEATSKSDERRGARRGSGLRRCAPTDGRQSYGGTTHLKWRMLVTASAESNLRMSGVEVHQCGEKIVAGGEEEEEEEEEEATSGEGSEEEAGRGDDNLMCT